MLALGSPVLRPLPCSLVVEFGRPGEPSTWKVARLIRYSKAETLGGRPQARYTSGRRWVSTESKAFLKSSEWIHKWIFG